MKLIRALANPARSWLDSAKCELQLCRALMRFPSLRVQRPSVWHFDTLRALEIGENVSVGPFTEILAYRRSRRSRIAGKLILHNGVILTAGCNIRAAGGVIEIGENCGIGQGTVVVASSHMVGAGKIYVRCEWDEEKTGVTIGANCWIGAGTVLLPGVSVGKNSVIGAGSVVNKSVPENEIWGGVPARFLKTIT